MSLFVIEWTILFFILVENMVIFKVVIVWMILIRFCWVFKMNVFGNMGVSIVNFVEVNVVVINKVVILDIGNLYRVVIVYQLVIV